MVRAVELMLINGNQNISGHPLYFELNNPITKVTM